MNVQVVIPYAQCDERRDTLFQYVLDFYAELEMSVVLGTATNNDGPSSFNHPKAINSAVEQATADVIVICDGDTLPSGDWAEAIEKVGQGIWPWSMPRSYRKLGEDVTERILSRKIAPADATLAECDWVGDEVSWAGFQVVRRQSFLEMGGWDERFVGWGSDDACFGIAMDSLVGGHVRFDGNAEHLWHRQTPEDSHFHSNWEEQQRITAEYVKASGNRDEMLRVIRRRDSSLSVR